MLEGDVGELEVRVGVLERVLTVLERDADAGVLGRVRARDVAAHRAARSSHPPRPPPPPEKGMLIESAHMALLSDCFS